MTTSCSARNAESGRRSRNRSQLEPPINVHVLHSPAMISSVPPDDPTVCPHCGAPLGSGLSEGRTPIENYRFLGRRHGPMKRYVEAGLTDRDVRRAMEAGIDSPSAIIAFCKHTPDAGSSAEKPAGHG